MRCGMKNFLFGPAAAEKERHTAERHHADRVRHESYWHEAPQAAHFANILFAVASVNHGACTEEQEGFEKTVREQVHYPSSNTADPKRDHHQTKLRNGRVSQNPLDVRLGDGDQRCHQRCRHADPHNDRERRCYAADRA